MAARTSGSSGIHMTKFGKHPDKDVSTWPPRPRSGALADGGVTHEATWGSSAPAT